MRRGQSGNRATSERGRWTTTGRGAGSRQRPAPRRTRSAAGSRRSATRSGPRRRWRRPGPCSCRSRRPRGRAGPPPSPRAARRCGHPPAGRPSPARTHVAPASWVRQTAALASGMSRPASGSVSGIVQTVCGSRGWAAITKPNWVGRPAGDLVPGEAAVVRPVDAAVVLLVEPLGPIGGEDQLVDALPELRVLLRVEVRADAAITGRPASHRRPASRTRRRRRSRPTCGPGRWGGGRWCAG